VFSLLALPLFLYLRGEAGKALLTRVFVLGTGNAPQIGYTPAFVAFAALHGLNTWLWVVVVVGAVRMCLGFENRALRYLRDAVYPTYILHQTVIVAIGFLVVPWELGVAGKFAFIVLASIAVTLTLYELLRCIGVLRPLFGLKPRGRHKVGAVTGDPNHG